MVLKSMHKLFLGFVLAVKLILQIDQIHLPSVLQKTSLKTQK